MCAFRPLPVEPAVAGMGWARNRGAEIASVLEEPGQLGAQLRGRCECFGQLAKLVDRHSQVEDAKNYLSLCEIVTKLYAIEVVRHHRTSPHR
jgi:hypothetical protein